MAKRFADILGRLEPLIETTDKRELNKVLDALASALDNLEGGRTVAAVPRRPAAAGAGSGGAVGGGSGTTVFVDGDTFKATAADGVEILAGHVVSLSHDEAGRVAYLADASVEGRRADAVVVRAEVANGVTRLTCATRGKVKIKLASAANAVTGCRLYLSAVNAGRLTDDPNESASRLFEQDVGLFCEYAKNGMNQVISTVGIVDVQLPPPASLPVEA